MVIVSATKEALAEMHKEMLYGTKIQLAVKQIKADSGQLNAISFHVAVCHRSKNQVQTTAKTVFNKPSVKESLMTILVKTLTDVGVEELQKAKALQKTLKRESLLVTNTRNEKDNNFKVAYGHNDIARYMITRL